MKLLLLALLSAPISWALSMIPPGFEVTATTSAQRLDRAIQTIQQDAILTIFGPTGQQGNVNFTFGAQFNDVSLWNNLFVSAAINGISVYSKDSLSQGSRVSADVGFTFGVPQLLHFELTASAENGPLNKYPSELNARLRLVDIAGSAFVPGSGPFYSNDFTLVAADASAAPAVSNPEPASFVLIAVPLVWLARRRWHHGVTTI